MNLTNIPKEFMELLEAAEELLKPTKLVTYCESNQLQFKNNIIIINNNIKTKTLYRCENCGHSTVQLNRHMQHTEIHKRF